MISIIIMVVVLLSLLYIVMYFGVRGVLKRFLRRTDQKLLGIDYGDEFLKLQLKADEWSKDNPEEIVSIFSDDGLKLSAHWWDRGRDTTVLFVHGYGNSGSQVTLVATAFIDQMQANILAPDCRASGESEGEWIGFGWPDRFDVLKWIEFLIKNKGTDHKIILFGLSMGGSTVLSVSGEQLPPNVKVICSDCGYSSLSKMFKIIIKQHSHMPSAPVMFMIDRLFKKWFGYSVYEVEPIEQVKKATTPILFIHGEDDQFVPSFMVRELYEACPTRKKLLVVPNATHALSALVDWDNYCNVLINFCKSAVDEA